MELKTDNTLSLEDSEFLSISRSVAITAIVFGHVGGFWAFKPYSEYLHVWTQVFFFISGAVSYYSFFRAGTIAAYYRKRIPQLLIPYYLLCILCLLVYLAQNRSLPPLEFSNLMRWITVNPVNSIMPFEVAQVWFLHTLLVITIVSPIYFLMLRTKPVILWLFVLLPIAFAGFQTFSNVAEIFFVSGHNLYKPFEHSVFFIFGIFFFCPNRPRKAWLLPIIAAGSLAVCAAMLLILHIDPDFSHHYYSPDFFFIFVNILAISILMLAKSPILFLFHKFGFVRPVIAFVHRHTFSIFLLHNFAIYIAENGLGMVHQEHKTLIYAITKFSFVVALTAVMSPSFTKLSSFITDRVKMYSFGMARSISG